MDTPQNSSVLGFFGRLAWMFVGPIALFLLIVNIARTGGGWWTPSDIAFFVFLGLMLLGRFLEFLGGSPQTASGEPATKKHLARYLVLAPVIAAAVWIVANLIGNQ